MSLRLRGYDITPPGGFPYEQTKGIRHSFPSVPVIEDQAHAVAAFRKANGLPRSSVAEALADVDNYTCRRLGGMAQWCVDSSTPGVSLGPSSPIITPCASCGAPLT